MTTELNHGRRFAKLFDLADGHQLLLYIEIDGEARIIHKVSIVGGLQMDSTMRIVPKPGPEDDEAALEALDAEMDLKVIQYVDNFTVEQAEQHVAGLKEMVEAALNEQAGEDCDV